MIAELRSRQFIHLRPKPTNGSPQNELESRDSPSRPLFPATPPLSSSTFQAKDAQYYIPQPMSLEPIWPFQTRFQMHLHLKFHTQSSLSEKLLTAPCA